MGFLEWLRGPEPVETRHTDTDPSAYPIEWQLDAVMWHQHHGQISPLAVPAVYAAIDLISASIAQLETSPAPPLSLNPDPFSTRYDFFFETVWSLCWHGDAFWLKTPTDRGIDSMQVLDPEDVDVEWDDTLGRRRRTYRWKTKDVPTERISHLRFHPRPGELEGLSPIEAARLTWEGAAYCRGVGVILVQRIRRSLGCPEGPHSSHLRRSHRTPPPMGSSPEREQKYGGPVGGDGIRTGRTQPFRHRVARHTLIERPGSSPDLSHPLRHARSRHPRRSLIHHL